jgi:hypothetical protein
MNQKQHYREQLDKIQNDERRKLVNKISGTPTTSDLLLCSA